MITVSYKDKKYLLTFTRESVVYVQNRGFEYDKIPQKPNIMIPILFQGAFYAKHRDVKTKLCDEIFDSLKDKSALIAKLIEMYNECVNSLFDDSEDSEGNATWEES